MQKCRIKVFVSPSPNIVFGTKKNRLIETVLLSTQNKYLDWVRVSLQFYSPKVSFSGPMYHGCIRVCILEFIFNKTANTKLNYMSLHARKHDVVGCENQRRKTASHRRSLIRAFVICSLLNSIPKLTSETRNFTF